MIAIELSYYEFSPIYLEGTLTMADTVLLSTSIEGLRKIAEGKVRDLYEVNENTLLFVASDRISAYDVIMKNVGSVIDPNTYSF
jgi:phosphoribosylaminoimidazole-succinocarboxamide synthase